MEGERAHRRPSARARARFVADTSDLSTLPGVVGWSHGPYLDDWSKVPSEIAAKYNTSPTYVAPK